MTAPLAEPPLEQWRDLIDWYGGLVGQGGRVLMRAGTLIVAAQRRHEPALARLLLRADLPAVAWRVAAMFATPSRTPATAATSSELAARPGAAGRAGVPRPGGSLLPAPPGGGSASRREHGGRSRRAKDYNSYVIMM